MSAAVMVGLCLMGAGVLLFGYLLVTFEPEPDEEYREVQPWH